MKNALCWICCFWIGVYHTSGNGQSGSIKYAQVAPQYTSCYIVLNEVNFASKANQFIELAKYCPPNKPRKVGNDMKAFKVAFVNAAQELVIVCPLEGHMRNRPGFENDRHFFYLIGGNDVNNTDIKLSDCQRDPEYENNFPTGTVQPFGIVLLFNENGNISKYETVNLIQNGNPTTGFKRKPITSMQLGRIQSHMADFIVLGSTTVFSDCRIFRRISSHFSPRATVIYRDWRTNIEDDISLNRCGSANEPFQPESMRYADPSPGLDNHCEDSILFSLEEALEKTDEPIPILIDFINPCYIQNQNTRGGGLVVDESVLDEEFQPNVLMTPGNIECDEPMDIIIDLEEDIETPKNLTENNEDINSYLNFFDERLVKTTPYIWPDCEMLNTSILDKIAGSIDINLVRDKDVCYWLQYNEYEDDHPKATCSLCNKLYQKGVLIDRSSSPLLSTFITNGQWHKGQGKKRDNRNMIRSHLNNRLHQISLQYFKNLDDGLRGEEFNKAMMMPNKEYYQFLIKTERFIIAVYQSVRLSLPYQKFPILIDTLKYANLDLGELHLNENGVQKGVRVISKCLHKELLFHMTTQKPYFSIILDDSSDSGGIANSVILFQTYDSNQNVKTYHYALLQLKDGGKGLAIFETFFRQITSDKLLPLLQTKLVSMVSDGARTLQSVFHRELQTKTNNTLIHVHCHAHKLELAIKSAFKSNKYLEAMDKKVNKISRFYNSKAVKKRAILKEKAAVKVTYDEDRNILPKQTKFEIKRVHNIRWVTHHLTAYESILNHWEELVSATKLVKDARSTEFRTDTRQTASDLLSTLLDSTFLAHLAFLADIAQAFSRVSLILQTKNSNLIGKLALRNVLRNSIADYATEGGYNLRKLLRNSIIAAADDQAPATFTEHLQRFENSLVVLNNTNLHAHESTNVSETLCDNLPQYMIAIFEKLGFYFPEDMPSNGFDIFYPPDLHRIEANDNTGRFDLATINANYKWGHDLNTLHNSFVVLINSIVSDLSFAENKELDPEKFWTHYLRAKNIIWNADIREVVQILLVMPATSSSAEQSFSIANAIKTTRRYSLETASVDAELRIKLNGEKHISRINSFTYAREFVKLHRRPDDEHRALPVPKDDDEKDPTGKRYRTIFERPA